MARRFVDLSIAIEEGVPSDPPGMEPKITYTKHADSVPQMAASFPGLTVADMPDGALTVDRVTGAAGGCDRVADADVPVADSPSSSAR